VKLTIVAVGNRQPDWVESGCQDYLRRMPRELATRVLEVKPEPRSSGRNRAQLLAAERERIEAAASPRSRRVAMDERGADLTTVALADRLQNWARDGRDVDLLIGGADGLDPALRDGADETIRLSSMTLPHGLARLVLCEQLYRAHTLLAGHPYHRE
jgi:23S rRNA (pseudouridine1915-N3)-methyltransferase